MHWREPLTAKEQADVIRAYSDLKLEVLDIMSRWRLSWYRLYSLLDREGVPRRVRPGRGRKSKELSDEKPQN
ncbi:hypothetical protein [Sphingobium sp.]|uniref:hypothetical protein n=1 Tax=Sphingobium sp. TaxID=1912891 RepID=UPI002B5700BC|nr:hypothetical protein [Sphingobium sp.]HUD91898.1 hypothetical protein [Sphingobium sp.]